MNESLIEKSATVSQVIRSTLENYPTNFIREGKNLITFAGLPALLLTAFCLFKKRNFLIAGLVEFFVAPIVVESGSERLIYPFIPFVSILAVTALLDFVPKKAKAVLSFLFLAGPLAGLSFLLSPGDPFPEQIAAGLVLKPFVNNTSVILDRKPYSCFYAGLNPHNNFKRIPEKPISEIVEYAHRTRATFLVLDRPIIHIFRPQLEPLFDPSVRVKYSAKLQLLKDVYPRQAYEVLIFKIL